MIFSAAYPHSRLGFLVGSTGKQSTCNMGDLGLISDWEDPMEKERLIHSSISGFGELHDCTQVHAVAKSQMTELIYSLRNGPLAFSQVLGLSLGLGLILFSSIALFKHLLQKQLSWDC